MHWSARPVFALYERRTERRHEKEQLLSVYRDYGVIPKASREDNFNRPSLDLSNYQLVLPSDLALNKMKTWQGSLAVSQYQGIVSPAYIVCRPRHGEHDKYLHYLLRSPSYITQYARLSYGIRVAQWDMRFGDFRRVEVLIPPIDEQRVIAEFLDRKTAEIDALIAKKERLIELLQEKRAALITQAVTKGLDPAVPMKDSGVEWLGQIPAHWELVPMAHLLSRITYGFTNPMPVSDDGPYMLTANDIGDGQILYENARMTTIEAFESELTSKSKPRVGDILLTKDGTLGRIAVADGVKACINQSVALIRLKAGAAEIDFVQNALRASAYQDRMVFEAGGTTIKHLYVSRLAKMPIAMPLSAEQREINHFIHRWRTNIDLLIASVGSGISYLSEYRSALISAAVTGKVDVREEAT